MEDFSGDIKVVEESFDQVKGLCSTQVQKTVETMVRGVNTFFIVIVQILPLDI
jgi:hypothetical protein